MATDFGEISDEVRRLFSRKNMQIGRQRNIELLDQLEAQAGQNGVAPCAEQRQAETLIPPQK